MYIQIAKYTDMIDSIFRTVLATLVKSEMCKVNTVERIFYTTQLAIVTHLY